MGMGGYDQEEVNAAQTLLQEMAALALERLVSNNEEAISMLQEDLEHANWRVEQSEAKITQMLEEHNEELKSLNEHLEIAYKLGGERTELLEVILQRFERLLNIPIRGDGSNTLGAMRQRDWELHAKDEIQDILYRIRHSLREPRERVAEILLESYLTPELEQTVKGATEMGVFFDQELFEASRNSQQDSSEADKDSFYSGDPGDEHH